MSDDIPTQLAETIQTAHLELNPDTNPPTVADDPPVAVATLTADEKNDLDDSLNDDSDADIPLSVLRLAAGGSHRHRHFSGRAAPPQAFPIPDLRFEQSYLRSIEGAETYWKVAWITLVHQVMMPLIQGVGYNLIVLGWRSWNKGVQMHGSSVGARTRRWWWNVNNWKIPSAKKTN